jgi:hypothetical protein
MNAVKGPIYIIHRPPMVLGENGCMMHRDAMTCEPKVVVCAEAAKTWAECMAAHVAELPGVPDNIRDVDLAGWTLWTFD